MNKKVLLGLGGIFTIATPTLTIVSCSSGNGSEISSEAQKEYDKILSSDGKNLLLDSLKKSKTIDGVKTAEEVKKIAEDKLNNINEKDLERLFKIQTMLGAWKQLNETQSYTILFDIRNFRYDKSNKKVSFDYYINGLEELFKKEEKIGNDTGNEILSFQNIKLEANTTIKKNEKGEQIVVPIINFAKTQDKDANAKIKDYTYSWYLNKNKSKEEWKKENPDKDDKEFEKWFDEYEKIRNEFTTISKKIIGKEIGRPNDKFNISSKFNIIDGRGLLIEWGYSINDEQNKDLNFIFSQKPIVGSSILFSQEKDKKIEWEIYKLKTNENPSKN